MPRVSVVQVGTAIDFPNSDNIRHSVYSFSPAKTFELKLYAGRAAPPVTFDKTGIVVLGCEIHDTMVAWLLVVSTPYYGKSDSRGIVTLHDLRAGDYELRAWHEPMRQEAAERALRVAVAASRLPDITVRLDAQAAPPQAPPASAMSGMPSMSGMAH
ncbi:MAG: methylamine utilization protein [Steroidobacteraceae bacterium]